MIEARKTVAARLAALALLASLIAAALAAIGMPLGVEYRVVLADVERQRIAVDGYRSVVARAPALRAEIAALENDASLEGLALAPASDSAATAAMQDAVQTVVTDAGAWLATVDVLTPTPADGYRRIGLRIQFSADVGALGAILRTLEFGRPVIVVDNLSVHARTSRAVGNDRPLEVRADLFAFKPAGAQ
jgi:hypothetical protein